MEKGEETVSHFRLIQRCAKVFGKTISKGGPDNLNIVSITWWQRCKKKKKRLLHITVCWLAHLLLSVTLRNHLHHFSSVFWWLYLCFLELEISKKCELYVGSRKLWPNQDILYPYYIADRLHLLMNRLAILLQYTVITVVVYSCEYPWNHYTITICKMLFHTCVKWNIKIETN